MISNKFTINEAEIKIKHEQCSDPQRCRDDDIFVESCSSKNNTLSTITFRDDLTICVFWESYSSCSSQELLYVPETGVLFLGCGSLSARVAVQQRRLLDVKNICLFWGFSRHKDFVLETGELECFLYSLSGAEISTTAVDPPYEIDVTENGIKFESIVLGTTWLRFEVNC